MLKAGILEIGDVFVVNKADMDGAATTVTDLREMLHMRESSPAGHHGAGATTAGGAGAGTADEATSDDGGWDPRIVETVATEGRGVDDLVAALDDHAAHLRASGERERQARRRYAAEIRQLLRADAAALLEAELDRHGGIESLADAVQSRETDPYSVADAVLEPLADCVRERRE
jgi:LAO/AO transport system kinase